MIDKSDCVIERITGTGPGGQHRNKTASCVRVTHKPTGLQVTIDGRYQHKNLAVAMKELERRIKQAAAEKVAAGKKERRDVAIKTRDIVRDYDFKTGLVHDRRTGKSATIKQVLGKGRIDLIAPTMPEMCRE